MQTAQEDYLTSPPLAALEKMTPKALKELEDKLILKKEFLNVRRNNANTRKKSHTPNNQFKSFNHVGAVNPMILHRV